MSNDLHLGTCSWKYESWRGLVYSDAPHPDYLAEYSRKFDCVEIDQWFWNLFGVNKVVLPHPKTVSEYASVDFPMLPAMKVLLQDGLNGHVSIPPESDFLCIQQEGIGIHEKTMALY